ncbi:type IX secretion system membrane protein PorP/SprF [Flavobacteriaceae bacterium R38]|nr:type IX secretion system membrane protein PorP/SprF [Flavobacteriaceae bacterium R38]
MKYILPKIIIFFLFLTGIERVYAQQPPNYVLYRYTMNVINPAYAAADGTTSFTFDLRSQLQGIDGSPRTQTFFGSIPYNERIGLGLSVVNDRTFIERETGVFVDFSYKLQLSDDVNLFLGLKAGGEFIDINANGLQTFNSVVDPLLQDENLFNPNVGVGFLLQHENYFVSLSSPGILNTNRFETQNGVVTEASNELLLFLSGGYNFTISDEWLFKPSFLLRYLKGIPLSADITTAFQYNAIIEFGVAYRTDSAISGLALFTVNDWLDIGYAYDNSLRSELTEQGRNTHEFLLKFKIL